MTLAVHEIFYSIQGEAGYAGRPCIFIRLAGCNLRCAWCDTPYAYERGDRFEIASLIGRIASYPCRLVEVTGGEPLIQEQTPALVEALMAVGYEVLVETNGSLDISRLPANCVRVVDIKCPSSGEQARNDLNNLDRLTHRDELKFIIADRRDYEFARHIVRRVLSGRPDPGRIHFSPVFGVLAPRDLAAWLLEDGLGARLQLQLHKFIWDPQRTGV